MRSPSSRRAWIEICTAARPRAVRPVALLAEGVDRNLQALPLPPFGSLSPSSRRAWIEILHPPLDHAAVAGRPPRGGRG